LSKSNKSECLLLESQVQVMQDVFQRLDKHDDRLLRRYDLVMGLRTDEQVVDFIDVDAVQLPHSRKKLTLDEVLVEVEKDERRVLSG